jgi:hypothetical protein
LDGNLSVQNGGNLTISSGNIVKGLSGSVLYVSNDYNGGEIWAEGMTFNCTLNLGSGSTGLIKYSKFTNSDYNYFDGNMGVIVTNNDFSASKARAQGTIGPIHLEGNWWGTTNTDWISQNKIYDHTDIGSLPVISFVPILSAAPVFAEHLEFTVQPHDATAGAIISPPVKVAIKDPDGTVVVGDSSNVTVAIGTNPGGGTLSGTVTVAVVNGVATFGNLSIDKAGIGYTLTATDGSMAGATSSSFNVSSIAVTYTWSGNGSNNKWTTAANWVGGVAPLPGDSLVFPAGAARLTNFNDFVPGTLFGLVTVSGSGYNLQGNPYQSSSVVVQPNAQLEVASVNTGILTLGVGSRITISPIPGGPQATTAAVASLKTTDTQVIEPIKPTSYDTSDPNPIASSESESTTIVPTAVQQQLTIIDMKTATILAASNDLMPIPCLESRLESNVTAVSEHIISPVASTTDVKLFNSSATRQTETVTSRSLPQLPIYWWFDTQASYTRAIEEHFSKLISENRLNDPKDRLSTSSLDELSSTQWKAIKHPAAVITGSQNAHHAAFQSIIQNSTEKSGDGQVEELDLDMLSRIHSKTQTKQFEKAVDALLAVEL